MKNFLILLIIIISSCSTQKKVEYDYYYFSYTAFWNVKNMIDSSTSPGINLTTIDGVGYTCKCPPDFIEREYKKNFPDVVLVKKKVKGTGIIQIHH